MDKKPTSAAPFVWGAAALILLGVAALSEKGNVWALLFVILCAVVYLLPWIVASQRDSRHQGSVAVINILLGWTLVGWVVAMAIALAGRPPGEGAPAPASNTRACPFCAEQIKAAAIRCKHCGADVPPITPAA